MIISDEAALKAAIEYLDEKVPDVKFAPESQGVPAVFPCALIGVRSNASRLGISSELLANLTITVSVYAESQYATDCGSGVLTIYDQINAAMIERHFVRSNQTEPYYNSRCRKWCKDGNFIKKSNHF